MKNDCFNHRPLFLAASLLLAGALQSGATQLVRELWDNVPVGPLQGLTNGTTSLGFNPAGKWAVNTGSASATNVLQIMGDDVWDFYIGQYDAVLPPSVPAPVGNLRTLGLQTGNTNGWDSGAWAVRRLATGTSVNCSANGTYYFSARIIKRGLWWDTGGTNGYGYDDAAIGLGFANGVTSSSRFVGAGFTRSVAANGGGGYLVNGTDVGDSVYISSGTLNQAGFADHPTDSGGPYYVRAYATNNLHQVEGYIGDFPAMTSTYVNGAFLVGRITTSSSGVQQMDVRAYVQTESIDQTDSLVQWDASYTFSETANMSYLLVWMHGNNNANPCYIDGIRVATTWAEVVGEEVVGAPLVSPTNTIYEGTPIVLSAAAALHPTPGEFQWMRYGTNIPGATDPTFAITNPVVADSGAYSVSFQNEFGAAASPSLTVTSDVQTLTVLPAVPPIVTEQPLDVVRYAGAPTASFQVSADGARPFTYQWNKVVGGITTALADQTNQTLTLAPLQASDDASYFVTVRNAVGSTNSDPAKLTVLLPATGSYAAAVLSNSPYGYWPMGETGGTVLHDYFGGHDGTVLDPTNVMLGASGIAGAGFPPNHTAVAIPSNGQEARVNLPNLPCWTNVMTLSCWLYTPGNPSANGLILNRDLNDASGYGIANGLKFTSYVPAPGVTNNNQLGYQWGGGDLNPGAAFNGYTWDASGLYVPPATWTFVALVLNGTRATLYMGTNAAPLSVATTNLPWAVDAAFPGTVYTNMSPVAIGRTAWPWADNTPGNAWANANINMSDVAIFYSALPAASINDLYLSALGQVITTSRDAAGRLVLNWPVGTLQSASQVQGAYTDIPGATAPFTVPPATGQKFYRVRR